MKISNSHKGKKLSETTKKKISKAFKGKKLSEEHKRKLSNVHKGEKNHFSRRHHSEESKLKKYNPNATWKKVPCKHCNGTGHKTKQKYNTKNNRMHKWFVPCPYCKGKGTCGMSKI